MSRLMDIDDLANYLKLKKQTIYNWLNQGKLAGIKIGGVWRFERKEIDAWLRSRKIAMHNQPMPQINSRRSLNERRALSG